MLTEWKEQIWWREPSSLYRCVSTDCHARRAALVPPTTNSARWQRNRQLVGMHGTAWVPELVWLIRESGLLVGFCREARITTNPSVPRLTVECLSSETSEGPASRPTRAVLAALSTFSNCWQHLVLDAAPTLGMALPLLRTGMQLNFLHDGLLDNPNIELPGLPQDVFAASIRLPQGPAIHVLNLTAIALVNNAAPLAYPRWSHWPFGSRSDGHRRWVAWCSRSSVGRRSMLPHDEGRLLVKLRSTLARLNLDLRSVSEERVASYHGAAGLIGIHGGALANMHVLSPGAVVVEINGLLDDDPRGPRTCFQRLALGLGLRHRFVWAQIFSDASHSVTFNHTQLDEVVVSAFIEAGQSYSFKGTVAESFR